MGKKNIAVFGTEPVTGTIGGLGIRQLEVARELHRNGFTVRLITPFPVGAHREKFSVEQIQYFHTPALAEPALKWAGAAYACQPSPVFLRLAREAGTPVAVDMFPIMYFEELEQQPLERMSPAERGEYFSARIALVRHQLALGDFFLCASERERDYYLGILTVLGKLRPDAYLRGRMFEDVIAVSPFGLPARKPRSGAPRMRGVVPGIGKNDFILLWGGSLWNWYDCLTPLKAMRRLRKTCPKAKLVFMCTKHPATTKPTAVYEETLRYVTRHGLLGKNVFFLSEWVPYDEREYYFTEADAGVATFHDHIENHFSFRIRVTDYLWTGLPVITNPGNTLSALVKDQKLGAVFEFGDDRAMAQAVERMATRPAETARIRERIAKIRNRYQWRQVLKPLVRFFNNPEKAAPVFDDALERLTFYQLNRHGLKTALFLRSAPMAHCAEALAALRRIAPEASIEVAIQPGADTAALGPGLTFTPLGGDGGFRPGDARLFRGKRYDAVVCAFNTSDVRFYANVAAFAKRIRAEKYWAFGYDHWFMDIAGLMR